MESGLFDCDGYCSEDMKEMFPLFLANKERPVIFFRQQENGRLRTSWNGNVVNEETMKGWFEGYNLTILDFDDPNGKLQGEFPEYNAAYRIMHIAGVPTFNQLTWDWKKSGAVQPFQRHKPLHPYHSMPIPLP